MPQIFTGDLLQPKWERFDAYARRIRVLEHSDITEAGVELIDTDSLLQLLSCLPANHGPLLPNLQKLTWAGSCSDAFLPQVLSFLTPSLQFLHVYTDDERCSYEARCRTIRGIAGRPDLKLSYLHLGLDIDDDRDVAAALASLLKAQKSLQCIDLPAFNAASPIAIALSGLQQLRELDTTMHFSSPSSLESFLSALAGGCPALKTLRLIIYGESADDLLTLSFGSITPLLRARMLSNLRLYHRQTISLQGTDIVALGEAWPRMESLNISAAVPISLLPNYAESFPKLTSLNIKLTFPEMPVFDPSTPAFRSLRKLYLSGEPPEQGLPGIGAFLSWVCPLTTTIYRSNYGAAASRWDVITETMEVGHRLQTAAVSRPGTNVQEIARTEVSN